MRASTVFAQLALQPPVGAVPAAGPAAGSDRIDRRGAVTFREDGRACRNPTISYRGRARIAPCIGFGHTPHRDVRKGAIDGSSNRTFCRSAAQGPTAFADRYEHYRPVRRSLGGREYFAACRPALLVIGTSANPRAYGLA